MEEAVLVTRMKEGDLSAFERIYELYHLKLFRTACLICGNRQEAEDVLQETFLLCWQHIGSLRKAGSFRYWIYRILTQTARDHAKRRSMEIPDGEIVDTANALLTDQPGAGQKSGNLAAAAAGTRAADPYDRLLEENAMVKALMTLDENARAVLVLYYYDELSVREIAGNLGILEGTVKSRLFSARKKLKKALMGTPGSHPGLPAPGKVEKGSGSKRTHFCGEGNI